MLVIAQKNDERFYIEFTQASAWKQLGYDIYIELPYKLDDDDYTQLAAGGTIAIESVAITPPSNAATLSLDGETEGSTEVITNSEQANVITKQVLSATVTNPVIFGDPIKQTISTDAQGRIISVINEY